MRKGAHNTIAHPPRARYPEAIALASLALVSCATVPPEQIDNMCAVFRENEAWYADARSAQQRWGTPDHVQIAIIRHESGYGE